MNNLRILTAGESHGKGLLGIIEGLPAGLRIDKGKIDEQLRRRQVGFGRGDRMKLESDRVEMISGVRFGMTLGSPIGMMIENRDWSNWQEKMDVWSGKDDEPVRIPRPGHADLAGGSKYGHHDLRNVIERASARETAMRVAIGAVVRQFLEVFDIWIGSHVIRIHSAFSQKTFRYLLDDSARTKVESIRELCGNAEISEVRCGDPDVEKQMKECIRSAEEKGDTVGGTFEVAALNVPVGLGSYIAWDRRLDGLIAMNMMGIPAIKSVEIGLGSECGGRFGSEVHDPIVPGKGKNYFRPTNNAGGIEGGTSNGEPIIVRAVMKPIPTLKKPLPSINLDTGKQVSAHVERSDVCAVPGASVVGESMLALAIGEAFLEKFGGDSIDQVRRHFDADQRALKR